MGSHAIGGAALCDACIAHPAPAPDARISHPSVDGVVELPAVLADEGGPAHTQDITMNKTRAGGGRRVGLRAVSDSLLGDR